MLADDPALGHGTMFVGHEDLKEPAVSAARCAVVCQVDLKRSYPDISHESGHRRDRPGNDPELGDGLIQGNGHGREPR